MDTPNAYFAHTNFTSGQWASNMAGRTDLEAFDNAVLHLTNWNVLPQGGARTRPGTIWSSRVKFSDKNTRLLGFEFNVEQTYVVEMGDLYFRFHANNQRLESGSVNVTGAADNGSGLIRITAVAHGLSTNNYASIENVLGTYEANNDWKVTVIGVDTFDLQGSTFLHAYVSGGTSAKIIELAHLYIHDDVFDIQTAQTEDTMYLFHSDYPLRKLTRTGATTFTITDVDFQLGPFLPINLTATTVASSATALNAATTLTASAPLWTVNNVPSLLAMASGVVKITAFTDTTHVTGVITKLLTSGAATVNWREGSWSSVRGFPGCGTFYDNRLVPGKTNYQPSTFWGSKSGEPEVFDLSSVADNFAYEWKLASKKANVIRWISGNDDLFIGTSGQEYRVLGGNDSGITPTNIFVKPTSPHGSNTVEPVVTSSGIAFIQRGGQKARLIQFNNDRNAFLAKDLSILANDTLEGRVVDATYEQEPSELVWYVDETGEARSLTVLTEQNVIGWAEHTTLGSFKSVETISTETGNQTWVIVEREENGLPVSMVEYFDPNVHTDCSVRTVFGSPVTTVTGGLNHLEGNTVVVVGDNATYPSQEVTNGALPDAVLPSMTDVIIGLPFTPSMELFLPERELADGSTTGRKLRVAQVILRVDESKGLSVNGQRNYTRATGDDMDEATPVETNDLQFEPDLDWNQAPVITQELPFSAHILAVIMHVEIGE